VAARSISGFERNWRSDGRHFALKDAFKKAGPIPARAIMKVEVTTPDEFRPICWVTLTAVVARSQAIEAKGGQTV